MADEKKFRSPGKKRKRQYGQGSLFQRADGMWVGTVSLEPGPDGRRRRSQPVYSRDKALAQEKLEKLKDDIRNGVAPTARKRVRVEDRMYKWAERKRPNWGPDHYRNVLSTIRNQIAPAIGPVDVKNLGTDHIDHLLEWMADQTKEVKTTGEDGNTEIVEKPRWSSRTRQIAYDRVRDWLDDELRTRPRLIRENVASFVDRPKATSRQRDTHTPKQAQAVLTKALEVEDPLVSLWVARYTTGLRQGELLGLTEDRVDLENLTIDVSWQLKQLPLKEGYKFSTDPDRFDASDAYELIPLLHSFALARPKTRQPRLTPIPAELAILLKVYLEAREPNQWGLVWTSRHHRPIRKRDETAAWKEAQERAGVPIIDGHGTRHTANSLIPVDEVHRMKFLGQSTAAANRIYLREDLDKVRAGQGALAGMLLPEKLVPGSA